MVITTCNTDFGVLSLRCTDDQYERLKKYNREISDIVESYRAKSSMKWSMPTTLHPITL